MRCWRIAHTKYALDRLCTGTALFGGRWNPVGVPALYCGTTIAITAMEKLVHLGPTPRPAMVLVAVDLPDDTPVFTPAADDLPPDWQVLPTSPSAQAFGGDWLQRGDTLAMRVPSVILPEEANLVINPRHPTYDQVQLSIVRRFSFDLRLVST